MLSAGQFAKLSAIFFSLLSSKYYYNLEESLGLIIIIYISVTMHLMVPECMWQCCFFLFLTHVGMRWNLSESVLIYGSVVLVPRISAKPSLPFLYFSFVDHQSENMGFLSLGMMTNLLTSWEKPYPEDKVSDYVSGDLSLIPLVL